ncbi:MAG: HNH endonuclease [Candidatus Wolfebacteria bacterium]|nr:HNH endonuclease [Candidatus Wolfebacteria bacterium]
MFEQLIIDYIIILAYRENLSMGIDKMDFKLERKRIDVISDDKLFSEMERVWKRLGHRPSRTEWEASNPTISYITYRRHFGGWVNACIRFIEFKMGISITESPIILDYNNGSQKIRSEKKRDIPLKLRLKILDRDNYTCVLCGRTPALLPGLSLHVDHRIPFSKDGKTEFNNLQTLCVDCNLGKGNLG